jgi:catechol 2,3-dioxygenase-like lactoylglutathione lyase family enzyme
VREVVMLQDCDSTSMIPTGNLEAARRFYEDVLQFEPIYENPGGITYRSGKTLFSLYLTQSPGPAQHTLIGWIVEDIEQMTDELRARGVTFEQYHFPGFSTNEKGIGVVEGEKGAWFRDSDGNILSIWETERYGA